MEGSDREIEASGFLYLNPDKTGFYRVLYDSGLQERIMSKVSRVDTHARWGMISDSEALFTSGRKFVADRFETIINTIERFFPGTGYTSRTLEIVIPLVGLDFPEPVEKFSGKKHDKAWELGIKKGSAYCDKGNCRYSRY